MAGRSFWLTKDNGHRRLIAPNEPNYLLSCVRTRKCCWFWLDGQTLHPSLFITIGSWNSTFESLKTSQKSTMTEELPHNFLQICPFVRPHCIAVPIPFFHPSSAGGALRMRKWRRRRKGSRGDRGLGRRRRLRLLCQWWNCNFHGVRQGWLRVTLQDNF